MKTIKEQAIAISHEVLAYLKAECLAQLLDPSIYNNVARILTRVNSIKELDLFVEQFLTDEENEEEEYHEIHDDIIEDKRNGTL